VEVFPGLKFWPNVRNYFFSKIWR